MIFTSNLLFLFIAGMCLFLVGINLAFIVELRHKLVPWFNIKLIAVTGLLCYTGLSVLVGNPSFWRACIAFGAVIVDMVAFIWMYSNVKALSRSGVMGLIPLARYDDDGRRFQ